jgi:hypothetical protein
MKFIFNDSFSTDPNLFKTQTNERSVFVSGNLIFEKSSFAASGRVINLAKKWRSSSASERRKISKDVEDGTGDAAGWSDSEKDDFQTEITSSSSSSSSNRPPDESITRKYLDTIVDSSDAMGSAADQASAKLSLRSRIVDQLKPFMSEDEIGKLFDNFIFDIGLPESEVLDFINYIIDFSSEAGSNIKELFSFATMHYATRREKGLTLLLLELGSKLQKKYPEVNFFQMMIDSANGKKPKLGKLAIINDQTDMESAKKIFSLAQHRIVEQNEALNRERREVKDRLQAMQERTNLQRALFDAMKMNEVERALTTELEKFGETFRRIITNPQFRALKDLQYTINAGRRLLDAWMSLYQDVQPVSPRLSPTESRDDPRSVSRFTGEAQGVNPNNFPSRRKLLSSRPSKFIKVAQAQNQQNQQNQALQVQRYLINGFISSINSKVVPHYRNGNYPPLLKDFMLNYLNIFSSEFGKALRSNQPVSFTDLYRNVKSKLSLTANRRIASLQNNSREVTAQQGGAQTQRPAVQPQLEVFSGYIDALTGILFNLGKYETFVRMFSTGKMLDYASVLKMHGLYENQLFMELDLQLGNVGRFAPSDQSIMPGGKISPQGATIIANAEEVDAIIGLFPQEQAAAERLDTKIKQDEATLGQAENNLGIEASQTVQLEEDKVTPEGDKAPLEFPAELMQKYEAFVNETQNIIKNLYVLLGIRRNMRTRAETEGIDPIITSTLRRYEQDILIRIKKHEETRDKYKSTNLIRVELERKRRLKQLLGPLEKQIQLFADAGISIASLISEPNGLLNVMKKIRDEEENALDKLIDRYTELKENITPVNLGNFQKPTVTKDTGQVEIGEPEEPTSEMI